MDESLAISLGVAIATFLVLLGVLFVTSRVEQRVEARRRAFRQAVANEARLTLALRGGGYHLCEYDVVNRLVSCAQLLRQLGLPESSQPLPLSLIRRHVILVDRARLDDALLQIARGVTDIRLNVRVRDVSGKERWIRWRVKAATIEAGEAPTWFVGTCKDVTTEQNDALRLRLAAQVMQNTTDSVAILDADFRFIKVNENFCRTTGYTLTDVAGKSFAILCVHHNEQEFADHLRARLAGCHAMHSESWQKRSDGEQFLAQINVSVVEDATSATSCYIMLFSDITEIREHEERLHELANYDALTGLPNRHLFLLKLDRSIKRMQSSDSTRNLMIAVLFIDLDNFKAINDSLGHAFGDELLRAAGQRIRSVLRSGDTVARLGGDEFVVFLEGMQHRDIAEIVAGKVITSFTRSLHVSGQHLTVSASIGISIYPAHGVTAQELIEYADTAMYVAKRQGRQCSLVYTRSMSATARGKLRLENQLRSGLDNDELRVHYQPIMDMRSGKPYGLEALVRWQHPDLGLLMPNRFIELAEERGLIGRIGQQVFARACSDVAALNRQRDNALRVSVNISAYQLQDPAFAGDVITILDATDLDPGLLWIELTESVLVESVDGTLRALEHLRAHGIKLVLDDFGTGYSSLSYLPKLPLNLLKIDKSFVRDIRNDHSESIIRAILAMASGMQMGVVAEGVELDMQSNALKQLGCHLQQGYLFSRPQDFNAIQAWLESPVTTSVANKPADIVSLR
jgi:diguanylate cyclase (GGDEF)-like protein/PAS domain S-box-containing protein